MYIDKAIDHKGEKIEKSKYVQNLQFARMKILEEENKKDILKLYRDSRDMMQELIETNKYIQQTIKFFMNKDYEESKMYVRNELLKVILRNDFICEEFKIDDIEILIEEDLEMNTSNHNTEKHLGSVK
jgi:hypothetical protein